MARLKPTETEPEVPRPDDDARMASIFRRIARPEYRLDLGPEFEGPQLDRVAASRLRQVIEPDGEGRVPSSFLIPGWRDVLRAEGLLL